MAQDGTKLQINFKLMDGTLVNVYANDAKELETGLTTIQDTVSLIASTSGALNNSTQRTQAINPVAYAKQALGATTVTSASGNTCKHGDLVWRESKAGAPKPWKGWFCPSPKGTPDQCEPKFVR